jgi:hypothetical protein
MYPQGIFVGAVLIYLSKFFIKFFGLDTKHWLIKYGLLFLYTTVILWYFSILKIEFDDEKIYEWRYAIISVILGILCILTNFSISKYTSVRSKVESIIGNADKGINEYIIMVGIYLTFSSIMWAILYIKNKDIKHVF